MEQDVVARAYRKVIEKADLTRAEREALKRHERDKEERLRWQFYRCIPQKHWREMNGRQTKVLHGQAARYDLPFGGASVDLTAVVRALHDFLADNALKLARDDDDPLLAGAGGSSPALERYREERAALAKLDRLERERSLIPRDRCREALGRVAAILRGAGDALGRQFGSGATDVLYEAGRRHARGRAVVRGRGGWRGFATGNTPVQVANNYHLLRRRSATAAGMKTGTSISGRWNGRRGGAAIVITQVTERAAGSPNTEGRVTGQYLLVDQEPATRVSHGRYTVDTPGGEIVTSDDPAAP